MSKKWSNPKGKKTESVKTHTRRIDVQDAWGRFAYSKNIKVRGYKRKKSKPTKLKGRKRKGKLEKRYKGRYL